MKNLNKQKGFTLIELVVVIVILGILAATAAPKFIDLQGDARAATIQAIKGAMESSNSMVHAKSLIDASDKDTAITTVNINSDQVVNIKAGWPTNADVATWDILLDIDDTEFTILSVGTEGAGASAITYVYPTQKTDLTSANIVAFKCWASYTESVSTNTKPIITVDVEDC